MRNMFVSTLANNGVGKGEGGGMLTVVNNCVELYGGVGGT